jgi:hypothetical protein
MPTRRSAAEAARRKRAAAYPLARFIDRIRERFEHDLRSELATIVNLASIVELAGESDAARQAASQVLQRAHAIAALWNSFSEAVELATQERPAERGDPTAMLRSVAESSGVPIAEESGRSAGGAAAVQIDCEPAVVRLVVRAFVEVVKDARAGLPFDLRFRVRRGSARASIEAGCGAASIDRREPAVLVDEFVRRFGRNADAAWRGALCAAAALVELTGGAVQFRGRPSDGATLRIEIPQRA